MAGNVYDVCIVGAGIIGLTLARELKLQFKHLRIAVLEKEKNVCLHGSGLNSGVLHAGFYYSNDSLKAKFCKEGNLLLTEYCDSKNIKLNRCGKLVVTRNESELVGLERLHLQAKKNSIEVYKISEKEAKEIEPNIKTLKYALWSPTTKNTNPLSVANALHKDMDELNVDLFLNSPMMHALKNAGNWTVFSTENSWHCKHIINCAGLYADVIAHKLGFGKQYKVLPIKGHYHYLNPSISLKTHVYPVPDLSLPFIGVHTTLGLNGTIKIGPSISPAVSFIAAFSRENYNYFENLKPSELISIVKSQLDLLWQPNGISFLVNMIKSWSSKRMLLEANELVDLLSSLPKSDAILSEYHKPGIRSQVISNNKLVSDFIIEGDTHSTHLINVISPGWTCSMSIAKYVTQEIQSKLKL